MKTVGMLLYPGFELLDVYGPLEMVGVAKEHFRVETVAETAGPIISFQGVKGVADKSFEEASPYDVLMAPGGRRGTWDALDNQKLMTWLRQRAETTGIVASICTGAALLARTGLLDGREATTNKQAFKEVAAQGPNVRWKRRARWVVDGKFFTSSGVSAGIDMSLALIAHLTDLATARKIAREAEYRWNEDANADEFADILDKQPETR